jgi:CHAD domain-containing protein
MTISDESTAMSDEHDLLAALRQQVMAVHDQSRQILSGDGVTGDEAVHALRVATKKLRALWLVVTPVVGKGRSGEAIDRLRDASAKLGDARDHHVMMSLIEKFVAKAKKPKAESSLTAIRDAMAGDVPPQEGDAVSIQRLGEAWANDSRQWTDEIFDAADPQIAPQKGTTHSGITPEKLEKKISTGMRRIYKKSRKLYQLAIHENDAEHWHDLRKWVKYLALALPIYGNSPTITRRTEDFTRLGRRLGKLHDHDELLLRIVGLRDRVEPGLIESATRQIVRKREALRIDCDWIARRMLEPKPGRFLRDLRSS